MKSAIVLLFSVLFVPISCKQAKPADQPKEEELASPYKYPALGNQELTSLFAVAEKADMIFYNHPFSINQDDAKSAKNSVLYVSPSPVEIHETCKPLGRLSWIADGKIVKEADFYMDSVCHYFVFMTNNQPVAANAMSEAGVLFFTNIFQQVQQMKR